MIKVYNQSKNSSAKLELEYELIKFSGGELHFKFHFENNPSPINSVVFQAAIHESDDLMLLLLMADYFKAYKQDLELLYTPYARQDRQTTIYEPFSFKTFAKLINSCSFNTVTLYDPHSDVTPALIENCVIKKRVDVVPQLEDNFIITSPDAGAMKANNEVAKKYKLEHISATKIRDVRTGDITATQVHTDINLEGRDLMILDDICDGGRTFIELAKVLKERSPKSIHLYTTVGLYSQGVEVLQPYFTTINSFYRRII